MIKTKQNASHAHRDQGGTSANIPNETSPRVEPPANMEKVANPSIRRGRGRENSRQRGVLLRKVKVVQ